MTATSHESHQYRHGAIETFITRTETGMMVFTQVDHKTGNAMGITLLKEEWAMVVADFPTPAFQSPEIDVSPEAVRRRAEDNMAKYPVVMENLARPENE